MIKAIATAIAAFLWPKLEPMIKEKLDELTDEFRVQMSETRAAIMADWDETTDQFMADFDESTDQIIERVVPDVNNLAEQIVGKLPKLGIPGLGGLFGGR